MPISSTQKIELQKFTDQQLLVLCEKYGLQTRLWRQKFLGLLPEVYKRRLYKKKGCSSIFEFAKKLAGISEEQVRLVLNLERRFEDKPTLHQALIEGQVSVNKLSRIASIATKENEEILVQQVRILPSRALETFVRDEKILSQNDEQLEDLGLSNSKLKNLHVQENKAEIEQAEKIFKSSPDIRNDFQKRLSEFLELDLSSEILSKLLELKRKGINLNQALFDLLQKRDEEIQEEKEKLAQEAENPLDPNATVRVRNKIGRHISQKIKKLLQKEYGTKCAVPHCLKSSSPIHHTARFALTKSHNPFFLAPLCEDHHTIAHSIDAKYVEARRGYG